MHGREARDTSFLAGLLYGVGCRFRASLVGLGDERRVDAKEAAAADVVNDRLAVLHDGDAEEESFVLGGGGGFAGGDGKLDLLVFGGDFLFRRGGVTGEADEFDLGFA